MSDKTSQSTEEEMLDQTFGGYDEEMTSRTEDPQTAPQAEGEKKKSSNAIIFTVAGVAAAGVIGYMFFGGNNQQPTPSQPPVAQNPAETTQPPAPTTPPVTSTEEAASPNENFLSGQPDGQNPLAGTQANNVTGNTENSGDTSQAGMDNSAMIQPPSPSVDTTVTTTTAPVGNTAISPTVTNPVSATTTVTTTTTPEPVVNNPVVAPVTTSVAVTPTNTSVAGNNMAQQSLVNELKQLFDQQTRDIKSSVDGMGNRIGDLEKANKSIEERLANLEAGKPTVVAKPEVKKVAPKPKKVVRKTVKATKPVSQDNNKDLLVDKSSSTTSTVTKTSESDVQIHSVYAGRVWTKNKDGSLSTYAAGDTLPSGEVIKRVDEDKGQIVTSKRVIK